MGACYRCGASGLIPIETYASPCMIDHVGMSEETLRRRVDESRRIEYRPCPVCNGSLVSTHKTICRVCFGTKKYTKIVKNEYVIIDCEICT